MAEGLLYFPRVQVLKKIKASNLTAAKLLFPDLDSLTLEFLDLISFSHTLDRSPTVDHPPLSSDAKARQRYRPTPLDMFSKWRPDVGICFTTYWNILPAVVRRVVHYVLSRLQAFSITNDKHLVELFSRLTALSKRGRDLAFGRYWMAMTELVTLRDYEQSLPISEFTDDIKRWVTGQVTHEYDTDIPFTFNDKYKEGLSVFYSSGVIDRQNLKPITITKFSSDPAYWARTGSSDGPRLYLTTSKGRKRARKSKWASALAMSRADVERAILSYTKQRNIAIQKREKKKVRAVITNDLPTYLKMAYVSTFTTWLLNHSPYTTLFQGPNQQYAMWERIVQQAGISELIKFPIDQSEFDHNVTKTMVLQNIMAIRQQVDAHLGDPMLDNQLRQYHSELAYVLDAIAYALDGGTVKVGDDVYPYEKGVLSGWMWTALIDTATNFAELYAISAAIEYRNDLVPCANTNFQGDDIRMTTDGVPQSLLILSGYEETGFEVHPQKIFAAYDADEYLRNVATPGRLSGYPARAIGALCFRNPVSRPERPGELRIRESLQQWGQAIARSDGDPELLLSLAVPDVARANKISTDELVEYMRTPTTYGGLGWGDERPVTLRRIVYENVEDSGWQIAGNPPGVSSFVKSYGFNDSMLNKQWSNNIEPPPGVAGRFGTMRLEPFVERRTHRVHDWKVRALPIHFPLQLPLNEEYPPTVVDLLRRNLSGLGIEAVLQVCDPHFAPLADKLYHKWSRRIFWEWVSTGITFSTPLLPFQFGIQVSVYHSVLVKNIMNWMLSLHRVSYSTLQRARLTVEDKIREWAPLIVPRMCG